MCDHRPTLSFDYDMCRPKSSMAHFADDTITNVNDVSLFMQANIILIFV